MYWQSFDIFTIKDLLIAPFYLAVIYLFANFKRQRLREESMRKYYMPAFYLRMVGCFLSVLMYQYYYHGGDMFGYHSAVKTMTSTFFSDPSLGFELMTCTPDTIPPETFISIWSSKGAYIFRAYNSLLLCQVGAFISLFSFDSCLVVGFIMSYFSFLGCWNLFEVFRDIHPKLEKYMAWATLFIPSVFFWGSAGLMKDTVTTAAIGYFTWGAYHLFFKGKYPIKSTIYIVVSFFFMYNIKSYIAIAFLPALMAWLMMNFQNKISNETLRKLAKPFLIIGSLGIAILLFQQIASTSEKFSPEAFIDYAMVMQQDHAKLGGSTYTLGNVEPTTTGMLRMAPFAIIVTLFRPYLWEATNPILLPSALEGLLSLLLTLYVIFKTGPLRILNAIISEPTVIFCLIFSLVFSFAVGLSAYNFGALARFKIPALPFYFIGLIILMDRANLLKRESEEETTEKTTTTTGPAKRLARNRY